MIKKWIEVSRKEINNYRIFKTNVINRKSQLSNKESDFFTVDAPEWITVVPVVLIDNVEHFVLVKQYRHGSDSITLEFPAGMVDPGENLLETARRELKEETGYHAKEITQISSVNPNPAFMTNTTNTFLAQSLEMVSEQNLDEHEEIEFLTMPIIEFDSLVGGELVNSAITVQAYYFYLRALDKVEL
jgi:8-oxo-dGTP pyrophosphatase MutT (NUDIX family)